MDNPIVPMPPFFLRFVFKRIESRKRLRFHKEKLADRKLETTGHHVGSIHNRAFA